MFRKNVLILACLLAGSVPALAQTTCTEPTVPAAVDGNAATQPQLVAAIAAVKDFMAKSDTYQQCLADNLGAQKALAVKNQTPFDPSVQQVAMAKVDANQRMKEKVVADINAASAAYKKKNAKP